MDDLIEMVKRAERNRLLPCAEGVVDALAHRGRDGFCAKCGGPCEYDSEGRLLGSAPAPQLPTIAQVMSDPSASRWLRLALRDALDRDCVDAVNDAELLLALLKARNDEISKSFGPGVRF